MSEPVNPPPFEEDESTALIRKATKSNPWAIIAGFILTGGLGSAAGSQYDIFGIKDLKLKVVALESRVADIETEKIHLEYRLQSCGCGRYPMSEEP